jgi:hypothetical protein
MEIFLLTRTVSFHLDLQELSTPSNLKPDFSANNCKSVNVNEIEFRVRTSQQKFKSRASASLNLSAFHLQSKRGCSKRRKGTTRDSYLKVTADSYNCTSLNKGQFGRSQCCVAFSWIIHTP